MEAYDGDHVIIIQPNALLAGHLPERGTNREVRWLEPARRTTAVTAYIMRIVFDRVSNTVCVKKSRGDDDEGSARRPCTCVYIWKIYNNALCASRAGGLRFCLRAQGGGMMTEAVRAFVAVAPPSSPRSRPPAGTGCTCRPATDPPTAGPAPGRRQQHRRHRHRTYTRTSDMLPEPTAASGCDDELGTWCVTAAVYLPAGCGTVAADVAEILRRSHVSSIPSDDEHDRDDDSTPKTPSKRVRLTPSYHNQSICTSGIRYLLYIIMRYHVGRRDCQISIKQKKNKQNNF